MNTMPTLKTKVLSPMRAGFTMMEVVIVVAVLAILVGLSFPAVTRYSQKRDVQLEQNRQIEIRNAVKAYVMDRNVAPTENNWVNDLVQGYTNLTQAELTNDIWNRPRVMRVYQDATRRIQGNAVPITYISLHSAGPDGIAAAVSGTAVTGNSFVSGTNIAWWDDNPVLAQRTVLFSGLGAGGDDIMSKMTDYTDRLNAYELTVQRIDRIMDALASYAQNRYTAEVERCRGLPVDGNGLTGDAQCDTAGALEKVNYFPRSRAISVPETGLAASWNYLNTNVFVDNTAADTARRTAMQNLMREVGLPIDYCCSALTVAADGLPMPFFYFSNPRQRLTSTTCSARPTGTQTKLSPRVVTTHVADGVAGSTCG
jgi:prepilin-type N-terminal cleavage/methylation domain-containing protein